MSRILIANRAEIALRVIRACRELGHETVVAHSEADAQTLPVRLADDTVCIGPAETDRSYLDQRAIIAAAEMSDADAIHPGYGMLAENASFAERVEQSDFTFIGPNASTIRQMGQKAEARAILDDAGMPVLPGSDGDLTSLDEAKDVADEIGFPIMLKASEGGGGRGISKVRDQSELEEQFERVQAEAEAAFGSGRIYIEKLIENPRHIEFQILGDGNGNVVQFFERECSIQRRNQKLIEEATSPAMTDETRNELASTIEEAFGKLEYSNVGTVEFVMDEDENAYVIEVNTRIQVEHPVTEQITGFDLIRAQINTALTGSLPMNSADVGFSGHSMEVRVCAEEPSNNFAPAQGTVDHLNFPSGPGIRVDSYVEAGTWISPYYDSMIGKIIAWDQDREKCIKRLQRALDETEIQGFDTTIPLFQWILAEERFQDGDFTTSYLDEVDWQDGIADNGSS
ncbi:MAG: acetyl/propionyl/methylcrotonyl-CoA carboxylase subunit alpha [bacterium]